MRRIRIQITRRVGRRPVPEVLPLDPRDPDVVRVKALARSTGRGGSGDADAAPRAA